MKTEHMVHMANQIALNFAAYGHDDAVARVADHLKRFWEKRMRTQLHDYVAGGGAGLHPFVLEAERTLARPAAPPQPETQAHKELVQGGLEE